MKITEIFIFAKGIEGNAVWLLTVFWIYRFINRKECSYTSYLRKEIIILYESLCFSILFTFNVYIKEAGYNTFHINSPLCYIYITLETLYRFKIMYLYLAVALIKIPLPYCDTKMDKSIRGYFDRIIFLKDARLPFKEKSFYQMTPDEKKKWREKQKEQTTPKESLLAFISIVFIVMWFIHISKFNFKPQLQTGIKICKIIMKYFIQFMKFFYFRTI